MARYTALLAPMLFVGLLGSGSALSAQPFQGQVTYRMSAGGQAMQMVQYIKDGNLRVELGVQGQTMVMLTDAQGERQIMLMPETKQWMDLKAMNERMAAMMGRMGRGGDTQPTSPTNLEIRPTGRTETVAGIECEHVLIVADGTEVDVCGAKGMGWHSAAAPAMGGMGAMARGMGGPGRGMGMGMGGAETPAGLSPAQMAMLRERFADGFFPLKMSSSQGGRDVTMEVVSLERRTLDDSLFRPPADYQEMRMPGGVD